MKNNSHRKNQGKCQQQASTDANGIVCADKEKQNARNQNSPVQPTVDTAWTAKGKLITRNST